ncbi:MAG: endopeptidase La [Desulforhopalus sp.]|nr:endopeptidase La [Desulforhopalus sp.]
MEHNTNLPLLPLEDTILLPGSKVEISLGQPVGKMVQRWVQTGNDLILATGWAREDGGKATTDNLYKTGVLLMVDALQEGEKMVARIRVQQRVTLRNIEQVAGFLRADYVLDPDVEDLSEKDQQEMLAYLQSTGRELAETFSGSAKIIKKLEDQESVDSFIGFSLPYMNVTYREKQELLETRSLHDRGIKFLDHLLRHKESVKLQIEMARRFNQSTNDKYRKTMLREQLREIQKELDEGEDGGSRKKNYREQLEAADLPDEVRGAAMEEVGKLEVNNGGHEEGTIRNYLDLILALPWNKRSEGDIDLERARGILAADHEGLKEVKERIIQHLAVMKLTNRKRGTILLLEGPPGTGKTSLGRSIAKALGRKYQRISLGGIRDEAEIRGHRRTYVGALPGRIISAMKKAGEKDAVFVLDEVDKLLGSWGDPASALLEVLDPEQNDNFTDHFLDLPFDLSEVFFIATANTVSNIPRPLLDRMEVISISGYTESEKLVIAHNHLLPKVLREHGLDDSQLQVSEEALAAVIDQYTREAGVRGLQKQLAKIARVSSAQIVSGTDLPVKVGAEDLQKILGRRKVRLEEKLGREAPGIVTGLAWTPVGGDILFIESTSMPGKGELLLTGQLGDVMKESARISLSLIRSRLANHVSHFDFAGNDIHIHVPAGSTPKDGPSAGITLFTSLASLITGAVVDTKTAMTGEITLRGTVLPVGGIKEKILAAHRAGIRRIILSGENREDVDEIAEEVRNEMDFCYVETIEDVIRESLGIELPDFRPQFGGGTKTGLTAE